MAKALGIVRKLDELGRIVLPKEVRNTQGWEQGTPMEMLMTEEGLLIREYQPKAKDHQLLLHDLQDGLNGGKVSEDSLRQVIALIKNL
jgi:AbrB family looped-hinge helix DNA binding protein